MHKDIIPLAKPYITSEMEAELIDVLRSGILSMGSKVPHFERAFAEYLGEGYCVAISSGTSALHLSLVASNIEKEDQVIVSPFSFIASVNCVEYVGAKPVFVDIEPMTFGINPVKLKEAITPQSKAILPTHVFGKPCEIKTIARIAKDHNLICIEDACEAFGSTVKGQCVGTFGEFGVFAFYPNKQMTTGEGGMIFTKNNQLATLLKSLRNQGRGHSMEWLQFERLGYNYRMSELHGALGYAQLKIYDYIKERRIKLAREYRHRLNWIKDIILPVEDDAAIQSIYFTWVIRVQEEVRDQLLVYLNKHDIQAKAYFYPCIHLQPYYRKKYKFEEGMLPVSEKISKEVVALPFFTEMTDQQLEKVCLSVEQFFGNRQH